MPDENALMRQVQAGCIDKLSILFERYHVPLFHYFLRTGNSRAASEDLVQETFTRVLAYRHSFNGSATFKSWLYGIASNARVDYYRKAKQDRVHINIDDTQLASSGDTASGYERQQQHERFDAALQSLDTQQREMIVLSRFVHLNYEEIAAMQQCNLNTLKSRMRKAISLLHLAYNRLAGEPS